MRNQTMTKTFSGIWFAGILCLATLAPAAFATPASDAEFAAFKAAGVSHVSAEQGKQNWSKQVVSAEGDQRACSTCHGNDLTKPGKHAKTQKVIDAMATGVTPDRYTDQKKIEKWFKRNCEWTWGRECTAQEKADFLAYLLSVQ